MILLIGLVSLWWLSRRPPQTIGGRFFLSWVVYHGFFESLPQVVVGAFLPQNDVGMTMDYLQFSLLTMYLAALTALVIIITTGIWLSGPLLSLSDDRSAIDSPKKRTWFIFQVATLPALVSITLILPFRIPGALDQVVLVPIAVTLIGIGWIQANAWRGKALPIGTSKGVAPIRAPLAALIVLLLFFQLILRPGIPF